jgi:hypothetical protein
MSYEQITLAMLLGNMQEATNQEITAVSNMMLLIEREEKRGCKYRSGIDVGAFCAASLLLLEKDIQKILEDVTSLLGSLLEEGDLEHCLRDLPQITFQRPFSEVLAETEELLLLRREELRILKEKILMTSSEAIAESVPDFARKRMRDQLEKEIEALHHPAE